MSLPSRFAVLLALLCGFYLSSPAAAHERSQGVTVRVSTGDQLVSAILEANNRHEPTTIRLARGQYDLTQGFNTPYGGSSTPPITSTVVIAGHDSADTTLVGMTGLRLLTVLEGGRLIIKNVTLTDGVAFCSEILDCDRAGGGAVANIGGLLWIEDSVVTGSAAVFEQGIASGGGISSADGYLHLEGTSVLGNSSRGRGGGISLFKGAATIKRSIIRGNGLIPEFIGGGIHYGAGLRIVGAQVTLIDSTVAGNGASFDNEDVTFGVGISNEGGVLRLRNSSITENISQYGGAGAGIFNTGKLIAENTTIGGNVIGIFGGGIYNSGSLDLRGVSLVRNEITGSNACCIPGSQAPTFPPGCDRVENPAACITGGGGIWNEPSGTVHIESSVLTENTAENIPSDCEGVVISEGHNALGAKAKCQVRRAQSSDQFNIDARLGELDDNGDAGDAHYPVQAGSPLIDSGGKVGRDCTPRDQLGARRNDGNGDGKVKCDVGAIEFTTTQN